MLWKEIKVLKICLEELRLQGKEIWDIHGVVSFVDGSYENFNDISLVHTEEGLDKRVVCFVYLDDEFNEFENFHLVKDIVSVEFGVDGFRDEWLVDEFLQSRLTVQEQDGSVNV